MKILLIGGTGTISTAVTKRLISTQNEVYLLNRGNKKTPNGVISLICDINDEKAVIEKIGNIHFDVVADFIAFRVEDVERDYRLFFNRTNQYIFISSASAYQKPLKSVVITEKTPLGNMFWGYSENKRLCEEYLLKEQKNSGFPVTIVRPSHTYGEYNVPVGIHGDFGSYCVIKRMLEGKKIVVHGDGESLWVLTHNSDFARFFCGLCGNEKAVGEIFHITSDEVLTWNSIYRTIAEKLGVEYKPFYVTTNAIVKNQGQYDFCGGLLGDKSNSVIFDNSKIKAFVLGEKATMSFAQGVEIALKNVLANKELQKEDIEFNKWCDNLIKRFVEN